jgi:hypothetical protein
MQSVGVREDTASRECGGGISDKKEIANGRNCDFEFHKPECDLVGRENNSPGAS